MSEEKYFNNKECAQFISVRNYGSVAKVLLESQKKTWQQLAEGYKSLSTVQVKTFYFDGFRIKAQFNPGRIISSSAKVDSASIKERKCFLCPQNLPAEQKGIPYNDSYLILANPFPIFPEHFTVPNVNHTPQKIDGNIGGLLKLTQDISSNYMAFYNGPKCGASAPDHFHFQAGNKNFMPIGDDFQQLKNEYGEILSEDEDFILTAVDDGLRKFISMESFDYSLLVDLFDKFYKIYSLLVNSGEEPMMNVLSYYEADYGWRLLIFLRNKHRSSHYFAEGKNNILLSAASVDLGGVSILPLEKDFDKISKELLTEVFKEISISDEFFKMIKEKMTSAI
ncbi:MAG: DUF4922 domain-containing protein [Ignavibacteriaceae bacterium]|nr:DUF4922 domain-containing protein [Ignavibacteriaceae bacterium]